MTITEEMKITWPVSLKFMGRPHLVWTGGILATEKSHWRMESIAPERRLPEQLRPKTVVYGTDAPKKEMTSQMAAAAAHDAHRNRRSVFA